MQPISDFSYYLRTGRRRQQSSTTELKFNPWHDPADGRFTFANQGRYFGRGSSSTARQNFLRAGGNPHSSSSGPARALPLVRRDTGQNPIQFLSDVRSAIERIDNEIRARENRGRAKAEALIQKFKIHMIPKEKDTNVVYQDSEKILTVGIGHKVVSADNLKLGDIISDARKEEFWRKDSARALQAAQIQSREAGISDADFVIALADVNFQLGSGWKDEHKKTWSLILKGEYQIAAREAQNSKWYRQTPKRVVAFQQALLALRPNSVRKRQ